jgi:cytochrome P450
LTFLGDLKGKAATMTATTSLLEHLATPTHRDGFPVMAGMLPGVGHAITLYKDALGALRRAEREQGPLVQVSFGFGLWYLFCFGPDAFELFKHRSVGVQGSRASSAYLMGNSILTSDGPPHRRMRSAMNPTFSPRGLGESDAGRVAAETVRRHVDAFVGSGGGDVHAHMQTMALDVIFRIVGVDAASLADWRSHYRKVLWGLLPLPFEWPGTPRYFALRATEWINAEVRRLVLAARSEPGESLLHGLVRARSEDGQPLSDDDLVGNLRVLFVAGHETTATTMTWATLHLAQRPELVRRLQDEVAAAGGEPPLTFADAKKLPLCEQVFREAVRLYTPAWFLERRVTEDIHVHDTRIPAGTRIAVSPQLWGRDHALYPHPDAFDPDRWAGRSGSPTPMELSQFGGGAHFCIGYHLSWLQSVQYLASLAAALSASGKRLRLAAGRLPGTAYFPIAHPSPAARVVVERAP